MKILTKHTDYALAALCALAKSPGQSMNVAQLAKMLQIPYPFLRGVFQKLSRAKIVTSVRGQRGGYVLDEALRNVFERQFQLRRHIVE